MDNNKAAFDKAIKDTTIHRRRKSNLYTFGTTRLNYIFVANSAVNKNDVIIRYGEIHADKPQIITPGALISKFDGFDEICNELGINTKDIPLILMTRKISCPNMNYTNNQSKLEVVEGPLERVIEAQNKRLDAIEDTRTALISGPESTSAISLMIYVSQMIQASAKGNIDELIEHKKF